MKKILIIEDEESILMALEDDLTIEGYEVSCAKDGLKGFTMAKDQKYLLEVIPLTGRAHQIRVQLSAVGCPIAGDVKYGFKGSPERAIGLHAKSLHFIHPVKKEPLSIEAPLPLNSHWKPFI